MAFRCRRFPTGAIVISLVLLTNVPVRADDSPLLETLRRKGVITQEEFEHLRGTPLSPAERTGLIELLGDKGVLTSEEATRLGTGVPGAAPIGEAPPSPPPAETQPVVHAPTLPQVGYEDGFFLRSANGDFSLMFHGRVSSNILFVEPGTVQNDSVSVDRARLRIDANFYKYFWLRIQNELTSGSVLRDAYVAARIRPEFNLQVGQFTVPFGYELWVAKLFVDFVERAAFVNSTMSPRRDIGVMVYGQFAQDMLQYQLAVMNGPGQNQSDNNSAKDVVGRLVITPFGKTDLALLRGFNVGGAVTYGHQPGEKAVQTGTTKSSIFGQTETGFTFFPAVARRGRRLRTAAHAAWLYGPYSLVSEYIHTEESRNGLGPNGTDLPDLDTDGAHLSGTWLVTGENKPFNAPVRPNRPLWGESGRGWGAWELALRAQFFKLQHGPDSPKDSFTDNRYDGVVAGINWYPNEFLRFSVNYLYGHFDNTGTSSPNPEKHSNNAVLSRLQLQF